MINTIKRWIPFLTIIMIIIVTVVYFLISSQQSIYVPGTDSASQIYMEACSQCHGESGNGQGLIYPALRGKSLSMHEITNVIRNGGFLMPAYTKIRGDTLSNLADYIYADLVSAYVKAPNDPFHIADDFITHDDCRRVAEQSLPQVTDVMNQVGSIQRSHQCAKGVLHGGLCVEAVGVAADG